MTDDRPPEVVQSAFGLFGEQPVPLGAVWDRGWRCGPAVLSMVSDHPRAAWSARVRENLQIEGAQISQPLRASDGRYVVGGWRADTFIEGSPEPRYDEIVLTAVRLHEALSGLERPRFLGQTPSVPWTEVDVFNVADRAAWEERPLQTLPPGAPPLGQTEDGRRSVKLLTELSTMRFPTRSSSQLVHGDLCGTVLFDGPAPPAITDITAYWRPPAWAAGVVVVDALSWGSADDGLIERWTSLPEWPQMLLRALMFRLAVHALHPRSLASALPGLERTAELIKELL